MQNYCIYLRKSRADAEAEARGEGETLARHEKLLLEVAKRSGYNISKIYREVVSGETIAARPQMQQLLQEVERGVWDGVLVVEVERLARGDTIDQGIMAQAFKYSNTKIITPAKVYDPNNEFDEEYFEFGLFMSRREYKTINRRLQRGRLASVKEGKYVGSIPPYGYKKIPVTGGSGFTLYPVEEQADVVRLIYELYVNGEHLSDGTCRKLGTTLIARKLNDMHIHPQNGGDWTTNNVRGVLINPIYTGKIRWNYRKQIKHTENGEIMQHRPLAKQGDYVLVEGMHPAIVSDDLFYQAQERLRSGANAPVVPTKKIQNPLSGIVFCAICGRSMVRRPYGKQNRPDALICNTFGCPNVSSDLHLVEERVLKGLGDWLHDYRLKWESTENEPKPDVQLSIRENTLKSLEETLSTLREQLNKTYDLLEQGVYDTNTFLTRSQSVTQRIQETEKEVEHARLELETTKRRKDSIYNIIPQVEHVLRAYDTLTDPAAKNELLKSVLERVEYSKSHGTRWHGSPDEFETVLFPRVPKNDI